MKTLVKILLLQSFWFHLHLFLNLDNHFVYLIVAIGTLPLIHKLILTKLSLLHFTSLVIFFSGYGWLHDQILINISSAQLRTDHYVIGIVSLWIIFIAYYDQSLEKFSIKGKFFQFICGGILACFSYYASYRFGLFRSIPNPLLFFTFVFIGWGCFFVLSLELVFMGSYMNSILDKSIIFSFDRTGFIRHQKKFIENVSTLKGKNILITGGTSGIGLALSHQLKKLNGTIYVTSRNKPSTQSDLSHLGYDHYIPVDTSNKTLIDQLILQLPALDAVVLNAGGMPDSLKLNELGIEYQWASQLCGHYYLIDQLRKASKLQENARIIWVSSGGMYLQKLDLPKKFDMPDINYNKVKTYANVKRAQVIFSEEMSKLDEWKNYKIFSMHPGWVDTPGLRSAIPGFVSLTKKILRAPEQGADTIKWLVSTNEPLENGSFYFDRQIVSPYKFRFTTESLPERAELVKFALHSFKTKNQKE